MLRCWTRFPARTGSRPSGALWRRGPSHYLARPSLNGLRRGYATVTDLESPPKPGEKLHGFTVQTVKHVPELHLAAIRLQHDTTGADYLHLARDDTNNVFSIGFKTNPPDDTGVPHILEHTTLCGSKRYIDLCSFKAFAHNHQISCPRPILQDASSLPLYVHERLHKLRPYELSLLNNEQAGLSEPYVRLPRRHTLPSP